MTDEVRITHQGPPRSGEVIVTDAEWSDDPARAEARAYNAIARAFFNQFLEWKVAHAEGRLEKPQDYDKEIRQYKRVNETLKKAVNDARDEIVRLEDLLARGDEELSALRERVNSLIIELGLAQEKLSGLGLVRADTERLRREGYNFRELMSPESQQEWDKLMKEIPYQGKKDTDE